MAEKKMTENQKRSIQKYLSQFAEMKIRISPEYRDVIQKHAESMGESATGFIKRAIAETIERDQRKE